MKENKKGFTLVELLAVIVIIGIVALIGAVSVNAFKNSANAKTLNSRLFDAVTSAELWGSDNFSDSTYSARVSIDELIKSKYVKTTEKDESGNEVITNPLNNEILNDINVLVYKKNNKFNSCINASSFVVGLLSQDADTSDSEIYCTEEELAYIIPSKGEVIYMDLNEDGKMEPYRVLKQVDLETVELLYLENSFKSKFNLQTSSGNKYKDSEIDRFLNSSIYGLIKPKYQSAIVDKNVIQKSWESYIGTPQEKLTYKGSLNNAGERINFNISLVNKEYSTPGLRHIYTIGFEDIVEYLGATTTMPSNNDVLTYENIKKMFYVDESDYEDAAIWLSDANPYNNYFVLNLFGDYFNMDSYKVDNSYVVRPVGQAHINSFKWSYRQTGDEIHEIFNTNSISNSN